MRTDAVLGAEAAAEARHRQVVDDRLQLGLQLRRRPRRILFLPHQVQVHAAVAPVAEVADADERVVRGEEVTSGLHEGGHGGPGHADVQAQDLALVAKALGHVVADLPQLRRLARKDVGDPLPRPAFDHRPQRRLQQIVERHAVGGERRRQLHQHRVGRQRSPERIAQPGLIAEHGRERLGAHHLDGGQHVAQVLLEVGQQLQDARALGRADERRRALRGAGNHAEHGPGDDAEHAGGAHEDLLRVEAGVVLPQRRHQIEDGSVGEHHLEAKEVLAYVAVAQDPGAGGVGGDHAPDRGIGAEVDREHHPLLRERGLELAEQHPALGGHRAVDRIDGDDAREALQAEHEHLAGRVGRGAADEAGVRALRHHPDPL